MAATQLGRAPITKGDIAIAGAAAAVEVIAGQNTARLTFRCDQVWSFSFSGTEGAPLGAEKAGTVDADLWFEVAIDKGVKGQSIFIEAAAAATLQVVAEPS